MSNHTRQQRDPKIPGLDGTVTFNDVLRHEKQQEILAEADRRAGADGDQPPRGSAAWLKHYQPAVKAIRENLSPEEKQAMKVKKDIWEEEGQTTPDGIMNFEDVEERDGEHHLHIPHHPS